MVVVRRRCAAAGGLVVVDVQVCQVPAKRTMNHETARGCVSVLSCGCLSQSHLHVRGHVDVVSMKTDGFLASVRSGETVHERPADSHCSVFTLDAVPSSLL